MAFKQGIDVLAGVIDADYRGEVGVILGNHSDTPFGVSAGDRIAQLILERIDTPPVHEVDDVGTSSRGQSMPGSSASSAPKHAKRGGVGTAAVGGGSGQGE